MNAIWKVRKRCKNATSSGNQINGLMRHFQRCAVANANCDSVKDREILWLATLFDQSAHSFFLATDSDHSKNLISHRHRESLAICIAHHPRHHGRTFSSTFEWLRDCSKISVASSMASPPMARKSNSVSYSCVSHVRDELKAMARLHPASAGHLKETRNARSS